MHKHSYENEFNLHVNEISFSYEKMGTKTRFEEEAKGNSEMAYSFRRNFSRKLRIVGLASSVYFWKMSLSENDLQLGNFCGSIAQIANQT